jgi:hypothetical protein
VIFYALYPYSIRRYWFSSSMTRTYTWPVLQHVRLQNGIKKAPDLQGERFRLQEQRALALLEALHRRLPLPPRVHGEHAILLAAVLGSHGGDSVVRVHVPLEPTALERELKRELAQVDVIAVLGKDPDDIARRRQQHVVNGRALHARQVRQAVEQCDVQLVGGGQELGGRRGRALVMCVWWQCACVVAAVCACGGSECARVCVVAVSVRVCVWWQ